MTFTMPHPTQDEDHPMFDQQLTVGFDYYGGCRGARGSYGEPLEPDDEPDVEILDIMDEKGNIIELADDGPEMVAQYFWDNIDGILAN